MCARNLTGQNELHPRKERRGGGWLSFQARIHEHEHTAFSLARADQFPSAQQMGAEFGIAPQIRPCLALWGGRQHGTVLRPQRRQTQGLERLKEGLERRLTGGLGSVRHNTSSR